jgi:hypothetical protein
VVFRWGRADDVVHMRLASAFVAELDPDGHRSGSLRVDPTPSTVPMVVQDRVPQ